MWQEYYIPYVNYSFQQSYVGTQIIGKNPLVLLMRLTDKKSIRNTTGSVN